MSFPPIGGNILVLLGNPVSYSSFPAGATVRPPQLLPGPSESYVNTSYFYYPEPTWPPRQDSFGASNMPFDGYPNECVVVVPNLFLPSAGTTNYIRPLGDQAAIASTYPANIVYSYNPASPNFDPVPNPNGTVGNYSGTGGNSTAGILVFPRGHTDTPYDMSKSASYDFWQNSGYFPLKSHDYIVTPTGAGLPGCCSASLTVTNLMSEVMNTHTGLKEYYYFDQASFDYTQTGKLVIPIEWVVCCWNDGTVINGTAAFSSIDVTTVALGNSSPPGFGFSGMTATTGTTITASGTANFTVTISSSYTPVIINVPVVSGKITFITDFWITSVVAPTYARPPPPPSNWGKIKTR